MWHNRVPWIGQDKRRQETTRMPNRPVLVQELFNMFFASILLAGLASTSWASPIPQSGQASSDCAVLSTAFPTVFTTNDCCNNPAATCDMNKRVTGLELYAKIPMRAIPDLSVLSGLTFLDLSANDLTGPIPDMFGNMKQLRLVSLNDNQLTGSLPPSLLQLPNLEALYLENNTGLSGTFGDAQTTNLPKLGTVRINNTNLTIVHPTKTKLGLSQSPTPAFDQTMANGSEMYPDPPTTGGSDPKVTWFDAFNVWHTEQIGDPTNLLNGKKVVSAIDGNNLCGGYWAFLYQVDPANPTANLKCDATIGFFNAASVDVYNNVYGGLPGATGLRYGQCPQTVTHRYKDERGSPYFIEIYSKCWTSQQQNIVANGFSNGVYTFASSQISVGYCCFQP